MVGSIVVADAVLPPLSEVYEGRFVNFPAPTDQRCRAGKAAGADSAGDAAGEVRKLAMGQERVAHLLFFRAKHCVGRRIEL